MNTSTHKLQSDFCKALAHPSRILIIELLGQREHSFTELMEQTGLLKSNLSQHVSILHGMGMLNYRKEGQAKYYRLTYPRVGEIVTLIRSQLKDYFDEQGELMANMN
ncbi:lsr2/espR transcriptional regulator [soil metagenome]